VHAYQVGHPDVGRHLAFRDYLRHQPVVAMAYGRLKAGLAAQHPQDLEAYTDGKDAFVKEQEQRALAWWGTVPLVLVTGPVGVGKTTVASALADALVDEGVPTACVDGDALTEVHPASPGDEMGEGVLLANLEAAWGVYRAAGARCLVLAQVVESEAGIRPFADAIPGADVTVIRLDAPLDVIHQRIAQRGAGESDPWHLERAQALHRLYHRTPLGHVTLDAAEPVSALVEQALAATRVMERLVTPPG
jgi:gluconate kinase